MTAFLSHFHLLTAFDKTVYLLPQKSELLFLPADFTDEYWGILTLNNRTFEEECDQNYRSPPALLF
jgi:hypothetical protein